MSETTRDYDPARGVNVKLPNGPRRIWPPADQRTHVTCDHWTADPDHLGRGTCQLGLFGGSPVLGNCLLHCDEYTGTPEQHEAEREDMYRKYAQPGGWEFVRAREIADEADMLDDGTARDAMLAAAVQLSIQGQALRAAAMEARDG